jgi:eukaryotic-like serine/threonine-protein kinase
VTSPVDHLAAALADRYRIDRELGTGGMATVYLAHDLKHDRDVAIKVLRDDVSASVGRDRFLREIRLAAKLSHPHILPLYDSGDADGTLFYVMPVVQGQSLRDTLDAQRQLPIAEAVRIASEVAGALDHAHRLGIIHRDIKPENILLQDGHVLVADFGIGKAVSDTSADTLTGVGISVGTPAYMSPEQAVGEDVDGRSDLYSMGCVLYEMIVGEPPFTGPTVQAVIAKRFVQTPVEVAALREGVPGPVSRAVSQVLARVAVDRYETAAQFLSALNAHDTVSSKSTAPAKSLAILPFENLSADPDNQYFADGIADDILDALTQIDGLHLAARRSAFSFRGTAASLSEIGSILQVATVLQGSVRKAGNRMRVAVQLVSVADGYHLWSERFDRELVDVFAVQDEIAAAIAAKLQVTFVPHAAPVGKATTAQVQAFELVAKGRALLTQRGMSLIEARRCLEDAIRLDPDNADAHAVLGDVLVNLIRYTFVAASEGIPLVKAAIGRALALDAAMASAIGAQALLSFFCEHDVRGAMDQWAHALSLQPRLSEVRANYALHGLLFVQQDDARAIEEFERAVRDDPRNAMVAALHAVGLETVGRLADADLESARACALDPSSFVAWYARLFVLSVVNAELAVASAPRLFTQFGRHPMLLSLIARSYVQLGDRRRAEAVYMELKARVETDLVARSTLALLADALGLVDEAMDWALESVRWCDNTAPFWMRTGVTMSEALRAHPRHPELLRAMGL